VAGGDNAINLYTGSAKVEEIQLGTLAASEGSLTASGEISSQQFDLSDNILKELAATDDALRKIKNNYMNFDPATKEYVEIGPFFQWTADIAGTVNKNPTLTLDTNQYFGYGLYFSTNRKDMGLDSLCGEGSATHKAMKLLPPAAIQKKGYGANATTETITELSNAGAGAIKTAAGSRQECMGTSFYAHSENGSGGFNWGGLVGAVAKGYWDLFLANQKVGRFDMAATYPFDAEGKPRTYLPALKITVDGSGKVTAITADLYLYIGGTLVQVTDLSAFKKVVESVQFSFTERVNDQQFELLATAKIPETGGTLTVDMSEFKDAWYWVDDENQAVTGGRKISDGAFFYNMYGSSFRFEYRRAQAQ
jgi:hypothetical protein